MKYPYWVPKNLEEKFDRERDYNEHRFVLLLENPYYERVAKEDVKVGDLVVLGTLDKEAPIPDMIRWEEVMIESKQDIKEKVMPRNVWHVRRHKK